MDKTTKNLAHAAALCTMLAVAPPAAFADEHHGDHRERDNGEHHDIQRAQEHRRWHRGGRIEHQDWDRGARIDYHEHHLHAPPPGYEWRQVGSNFILAAVATGVIASIIAAGH